MLVVAALATTAAEVCYYLVRIDSISYLEESTTLQDYYVMHEGLTVGYVST